MRSLRTFLNLTFDIISLALRKEEDEERMKDKEFDWQKKSTSELFQMIQESPKLFAANLEMGSGYTEPQLSEYLQQLLEQHEMTIPDLIVKTLLSKSFVYQIFSGNRNPGRDILLRIAFAMHLSVEETQHLFLVGGKGALYPKVRRDAVIIYCLEQEMPLDEANDFLLYVSERGLL